VKRQVMRRVFRVRLKGDGTEYWMFAHGVKR
jgi:hypothetical protein